MRAIGFRVEPSGINWAAVEQGESGVVLLASDRAAAPATYSEAEALSWYRQRLALVIEKYKPDAAAVRYPEPSAREGRNKTSGHRRCRIEGIVLDVLSSLGIKPCTGPLRSISSRLGSKNAKHYLDQDDIRGLDFGTKSKELREAILVAVSVLEQKNGNQDRMDVPPEKTDRRGSGSQLDGLLG